MILPTPQLRAKLNIGEGVDFEVKESHQNLSRDLWETYSAFANTQGGIIVLGVRQHAESFEIIGVKSPSRLKSDFFNLANNPQKTSVCLVSDADVDTITVAPGKTIILIRVPEAERTRKPVYLNGNPLICFKRNHEGDYKLREEDAKFLIRDSGDKPFDALILPDFGADDLDTNTVRVYRNRFTARRPDHPFVNENDPGFLEKIHAIGRDRKTGEVGLTVAGLLMFGMERSLKDYFPYYEISYQERLSDDPDVRWTYRLYPDGTWVPNLFQFYLRIIERLTHDLDVPFELDREGKSLGETHVHEALREALVNTLVHANHASRISLRVIKLKHGFLFANPGHPRISLNALYQGGHSDPRNPDLLQMFRHIGVGEREGAGFPKILRAWKEQHWAQPLVEIEEEHDSTIVVLPKISLVPDTVNDLLKGALGEKYTHADELTRTILIMAYLRGGISNATLQGLTKVHPADITKTLTKMVKDGLLNPLSRGRWTTYEIRLPSGSAVSDPISWKPSPDSEHSQTKLRTNAVSSEHLETKLRTNAVNSEHLREDSEHFKTLMLRYEAVRIAKKTDKNTLITTILAILSENYVTLRQLAVLLGRTQDTLRNHYVMPLLKSGRVVSLYPEIRHPKQAYRVRKNK